MRYIIYLLICILINSCNIKDTKKQDKALKEWIMSNQRKLTLDSDSLIKDYLSRSSLDSNWISSSITITKHAPNSLGVLANNIGDSTDCIVVELTFFKNPNQKRTIMIAAEDSTCLGKLNPSIMETDSTNSFIFGIKKEPLY